MAKSLDPPVKIMFPAALLSTHPENFTILGLGDMALPGMLVSLGASFDQKWCRTEPTSAARLKARGGAPAIQYLRRATAGYAVGLVSAMVGGMISGAAQPALMYLVPAVLATVLFTAWQKRELPEVWGGQRPRLCSCCPYPGKISAATKEEEGKV